MAFGEQWGSFPLLGVPGPVISMDWELRASTLPTANVTENYNQATMVYFQFVFAAITLVLIAGSLLGRMNFLAWMVFVPLWLTFSYTVGAFSVWGGGFLYTLGVIDYSGGYVIHVSSGTAGMCCDVLMTASRTNFVSRICSCLLAWSANTKRQGHLLP